MKNLWIRIAVSLLLVAAAVALPGLVPNTYAPGSLADTLLPAHAIAAPNTNQLAVRVSTSAHAQTAPSPMMGMMSASSPMTGTMTMDMQNMGQMMQMMGMMMQMMGYMQEMTDSGMGMSGGMHATEPMTSTMPMMSGEMDMMEQMMGMMGEMDATQPISGTMPIDPTHMQSMGMMMQMMGMMMQMMGHMHSMGMMGDMGMMHGMHATESMTGTMPMMSGDTDMMAHMMGMMSEMQGMMGGMGMMGEMDMMPGMMGGEPVTATVPLTESAPSADDANTASLPSQTVQAGMVSVTVQPLNLGAEDVDMLKFEVKLETHTGSLEEDLSQLAVLRAGDAEVAASGWDAPSGGHHIAGILSFPAVDENGEPILAGATDVSLILSDLAGAGEQVLTWDLTGAEMGDAVGAEGARSFDAQFIDSMIEHHQGAIAMAEQAQAQAEHTELRDMADAVIAAQAGEIAQMREWRQAWYPELPSTGGMAMGMGEMTISVDSDIPFDQRFIEAMISHHQGAIEMAQAAQTQSEHPEIRELAGAIITAQQAEIEQMQGWLKAWYE